MSDILKFPSKEEREERKKKIEEHFKSSIVEAQDFRAENINDILSDLMPLIISILYDDGYDIAIDENVECILLACDALRAAMYNSVGMEHPIQDVALDLYEDIVAKAYNIPVYDLSTKEADNDHGEKE